MVHVRHLLLDVEVVRVPEALDDGIGADVGRGLHREATECLHPHRRATGEAGFGQRHTIVGREHAGRLVEVDQHPDDDVAEQIHRLIDDVDVAEVERIETAGNQHRCHGWEHATAAARPAR